MTDEPYDEQAEQLVLAALMHAAHELDMISDRVTEESFYLPKHQALFAGIASAHKAGHGTDALSLTSWLREAKDLDRAGGQAYVIDLHGALTTVPHGLALVPRLVDHQQRRRGLVILTSLRQSLLTPGSDVEVATATARRHLANLTGSKEQQWSTPATMTETMLEQMTSPKGEVRFMSTSYPNVDHLLDGGLRPAQLVIIAGATSVGKSLAGLDVARHTVLAKGVAAFFSLEMGNQEIYNRFVAALYHIQATDIGNASVSEEELSRFVAGISEWETLGFHLNDLPHPTTAHIAAACRRLRTSAGRLDVIVVDYLQLVTADNPRANRSEQVGQITRDLKLLAKEMGCVVVALSQLNRESVKENREPKLSDLRESGSIEQDADIVILLHSEVVEGTVMPEVSVNLAKHRGGQRGRTWLMRDGHHGRMVSMDRPAS